MQTRTGGPFTLVSRFFEILSTRLSGKKKDHFLHAKYEAVSRYYGSRVLDFGAGAGDFSLFLSSRGHDVKALDVVHAFKHARIDFKVFDGRTIPCADNQFETSVAFFVLHHLDNQEELLRELKRVTSGFVIIGEDLVENGFDRLLGNIHLNTAPWSRGTDSFRDNPGWLRLFEKLGFTVATQVDIPRSEYPVYPVKRAVYVLACNPSLGSPAHLGLTKTATASAASCSAASPHTSSEKP